MLLRGCQLRNTEWVLGLVLSTGHDTKVGYRSSKKQTSQKSGYSDMLVNRNLVKMIALLLPICLAGATAHAVLRAGLDSDDEPWYLPSEARGLGSWFLDVCTYFILSSSLIPISFYVTRNIIFTIVRYFVINDLTMYDEENDEPCRVKTMHLLEEIGQVSHIFSDKTGTLTSNRMEFRRAHFANSTFGCGDTAIAALSRQGERRAAPAGGTRAKMGGKQAGHVALRLVRGGRGRALDLGRAFDRFGRWAGVRAARVPYRVGCEPFGDARDCRRGAGSFGLVSGRACFCGGRRALRTRV